MQRNPRQDKRLTSREIAALKRRGYDPHDPKNDIRASERDLFKDSQGMIYVKPKNGHGAGEPTGLRITELLT
jgi:hypothetical protein